MQITYSRLWDGYGTDKEALYHRNKRAKQLRKAGCKVSVFTLRNQLKKYDSLGQPNGAACNVYVVDYQEGT